MGQFNCFWPVQSESQKRQRKNAKQFKFLTQDSEKVYCRDSMRHKKSKGSAQMRPDGKRKSCAAKKISARADCCADATGQPKKNCCAATMRPDSKRKFCSADRHFCAEATQKKKVARADTDEWTATGQAKRKFLRALQLTGCDRASQKKLRALTLEHGCDRTKKKILHGALTLLARLWPDSPKKKSARPAPEWMRPIKKKKDSARLTLERGCDRTGQKKRFCMACCAAKKSARLKKNCSWQTCADRPALTGQRPVQPVFNAGSTGFGQDGPGKIWLKAAELKFSSEVQLASSSWTRKFSSPSQLSFKWKDFKKS
jgi:hypothetical protein